MKTILTIFFLITIPVISVYAQATVVFNVDMRSVMKDSTFIPGQDHVQIKGNLYPLGLRVPTKLKDTPPMDSVYTVEIRFPRQHSNKSLNFNFEIVKPKSVISEQGPRTLILNDEKIDLQPLGFNSFAF